MYYPPIETEEEQQEKLDLKERAKAAPLEPEPEYLSLKPERLAAIAVATAAAAAAGGGKKKERPRFPHTCTRCGKTWELAIQLDPTRPMYCLECRPIILEEKKNRGSAVKQITRTSPPPEPTTIHHKQSSEMSLAHTSQPPSPPAVQKPRVVPPEMTPVERGSIKVIAPDTRASVKRPSLLDEIVEAKGGRPLERDKKVLEARAGEPARFERPRPGVQSEKKPPINGATAKMLEKLLDHRGDHTPSLPPDLDIGLPPTNPPTSQKPISPPARPLKPGQRVTF